MTDVERIASAVAKPLFWYKATDHPQDNMGQWIAHGIGGRYSIDKDRDGRVALWWAHDEFLWEACADIADAKVKAEADWQKRFAERMLP